MSTPPVPDPESPRPPRRPYEEPSLRTFGSVASLTQTISREGSAMDGGPNNIKT
jgi:hypothetical protein